MGRKNRSEKLKPSLSTSTIGSPPMNRRDESALSTSPTSPLAPNINNNGNLINTSSKVGDDQDQKNGFFWGGINRIQQKLRIKSKSSEETEGSFDKVTSNN